MKKHPQLHPKLSQTKRSHKLCCDSYHMCVFHLMLGSNLKKRNAGTIKESIHTRISILKYQILIYMT
jgi:hypothetical protein